MSKLRPEVRDLSQGHNNSRSRDSNPGRFTQHWLHSASGSSRLRACVLVRAALDRTVDNQRSRTVLPVLPPSTSAAQWGPEPGRVCGHQLPVVFPSPSPLRCHPLRGGLPTASLQWWDLVQGGRPIKAGPCRTSWVGRGSSICS